VRTENKLLLLVVVWLNVGACRQESLSSEASNPSIIATTAETQASGEVLNIVKRPIPFSDTRKSLTLDYIHAHYDKTASTIEIVPRMVVLHWSDSSTLQSLYNTFAADRLSWHRPDLLRAGQLNVSAHFGIDRDGTVYQFMPETVMARHVIGLNRIAVGIENVGGPSLPLTSAQVTANAQLVRLLVSRFPSIKYLIGHYEYGAFRNTPLWEDVNPSYFTQKVDPGEEFMRLVRAKLTDLDLQSQYNSTSHRVDQP
jgi:N-acetylmuramoyl-L-alanine amidase